MLQSFSYFARFSKLDTNNWTHKSRWVDRRRGERPEETAACRGGSTESKIFNYFMFCTRFHILIRVLSSFDKRSEFEGRTIAGAPPNTYWFGDATLIKQYGGTYDSDRATGAIQGAVLASSTANYISWQNGPLVATRLWPARRQLSDIQPARELRPT
jgi:hypothetical protein